MIFGIIKNLFLENTLKSTRSERYIEVSNSFARKGKKN